MTAKDYIDKIIVWINSLSPRPLFHSFKMTPAEIKLFDESINKSKGYLEFGMGGSTIRVLQKSEAKVYSVESSASWMDMLRQYKFIKRMEKDRLSIFHVNIGSTHEWRRPLGDANKELFPAYSTQVFDQIDTNHIDLVLVDGRFRVACALRTVKECAGQDDLRVLFHDFDRQHYHVVLKYLDNVSQADSLAVLKPKKEIDLDQLEKDFQEYCYDSD